MKVRSLEYQDVYSLGFELLGDTDYLVEEDEGRRIVYSDVSVPLEAVGDADARVEQELNEVGDVLQDMELGLVYSRGLGGVAGFRVSPHAAKIAGAMHTFASAAYGLSPDTNRTPLEPFLLRLPEDPSQQVIDRFCESHHIKYVRALGMLVCRRSIALPERKRLRSV